jgi:mycothiol synthase
MKFDPSPFDNSDILEMRSLLRKPGNELEIADFNELIALEAIRANTRLWRDQARQLLLAFAFVDDFTNLCFAVGEENNCASLEEAIVKWGEECIRHRKLKTGEPATLDASCSAENPRRLAFLEKFGFHREKVRTLHYQRSLHDSIPHAVIPQGFILRSVQGEEQAEALAALHRAAFGTGYMSLEYRLAMMRAPSYDPSLDLFIEASNGKPVAFCTCSIAEEENKRDGTKNGYTDPIGVDPHYQRQGFGKAILAAGLKALQNRQLEFAKLGTSSENISMQRLAETLGFRVVSEHIWFTKEVD